MFDLVSRSLRIVIFLALTYNPFDIKLSFDIFVSPIECGKRGMHMLWGFLSFLFFRFSFHTAYMHRYKRVRSLFSLK